MNKRSESSDPTEYETEARAAIYSVCIMFGEATIFKVSDSLGSRILDSTYKTVAEMHPTIAVRLIDTAIRLEHFAGFPEQQVFELDKDLASNGFARTLLRLMVAKRLYLWPVKYQVKQRVCKTLGIKLTKQLRSQIESHKSQ